MIVNVIFLCALAVALPVINLMRRLSDKNLNIENGGA